MASLPTDEQIRARAEELQLIAPGAELPHDVKRTVAKSLLAEQQAPPAPLEVPLEPVLLSRITQPASGGMLRVDVLFIPNPTKG